VLARNTKSRHPDLDDAVIKQRIAPSKPHAIVHPEKTAPWQGQRQRLSFISQASWSRLGPVPTSQENTKRSVSCLQ